uniref:Winged helix-turn-helix domain-containing protein n=1 Tax=Streptomyces sp. NBC_00003 TaxID=2903608 RepID=A0AAU2V7Q2_9ACTN
MKLDLEDDSRPAYVQVADYLRGQIRSGELKPGDKIPTSRDLQEEFGVASATVQNAFRVLKSEGLIYSAQGRGSFVRSTAVTPEPEVPADSAEQATEAKLAAMDTRVALLFAEVSDLRGQISQMQDTMLAALELMKKLGTEKFGEDG